VITNSTLLASPPPPQQKKKEDNNNNKQQTTIALIEETCNFKHQNQKKVFKFIKIYGKIADSINK